MGEENNKKTDFNSDYKNSDEKEADNREAEAEDEAEADNKEAEVDDFQIPYIDSSVYLYKKKRKITRIVLISVAALIAAVYFGGVIYHALHFGTDTYINDLNVSGMTFNEAEAILEDELAAYHLKVVFKNGQEIIKVGDGDLTVEPVQSVKSLKSNHNPFLWPVDVFTGDKYVMDYLVSYDRDMLSEFLLQSKYLDRDNMEKSKNARVEMQNGEVVIIPDVTGTELDFDKVLDAVCSRLDVYENEVNLELEECYIPAEITADSELIARSADAAEKYLSIKACFDFAGYIYQIPREELSVMGYVDSSGKIKISQSNVYAYAKKLAEQCSTSNTDRVFTTHDGRRILVYGGWYGWVLDPETEGPELYALMLRKTDFVKTPACEREGYAYCDENDIGYSYVEVDLADQTVYLYINGKQVLKTECVSGQTPGHKTPGGLYGVTYMALNVTLKGADYESPVTFWMPFNGDIGLHDANWRARFGDDIYTYDGSHGCVNLPYSAASILFENIEAGFPVVCYWDDEAETVKD